MAAHPALPRAASDPNLAPIFIVGTGRSGTTLLRLMLCAHPRIYIAHETSFYLVESLYSRSAPRRQFLEYYFHTPWFRWLRIDPERVLAGLPDPLPHDRTGDAFDAIMREKAAQYGRVRYGDKTPSHAAHLGRIFADFPNARVIHMVRDPRSVALSLSRMPWGSASRWSNARYCNNEFRHVAPFRKRILAVRLEDLLTDARSTMQRVLDYVGEPWHEAVLEHATNIPDAHDMPPLPWLETAARPRGAVTADWSSMSPAEIRMLERTARRVMTEMGYEPARLEREPARIAVWWARLQQVPDWLSCLVAYVRIAIWWRDPRNFDGERTNALWHRINPGAWALYPGFEMPAAPPLLSRVPITSSEQPPTRAQHRRPE